MKKLFKWIALCLALLLAFGIAACSKEGKVAQSESAAFIAAVEEIGEVSLESRVKIDDAYAIYDELTKRRSRKRALRKQRRRSTAKKRSTTRSSPQTPRPVFSRRAKKSLPQRM